ncbi:DUF2894 domain-containing protein [Aquabacterium sp.]|uniref:DUF2894 domain-containing protein n=1 Tax=Aquabacterium sp. TaxID=1872578 RepID=UPI002E373ED2|nr:DUF2894 domain-containing protein [Aquabacterium sp.]HEX5311998.1 DUF2894 domain-containing protein [Aquabacterium sp.]
MSESDSLGATLLARWQACLAQQPAGLADTVRGKHVELMLARMDGQPIGVQQALAARINKALDVLEQGAVSGQPSSFPRNPSSVVACKPSPLAELPAYIESRSQQPASQDPFESETVSSEMKSVRRFSEVWSRIAAETQVKQAVGRGPENAGPLNSHMLMLRSLTLMKQLSTDYLRRFLSEMDTLLWLEQLNQKHALPDRKATRTTRSRK